MGIGADTRAAEKASESQLMDKALGLRAASLEEQALALAAREEKVRGREDKAGQREDAQRLIGVALGELQAHNGELRSANEKLVLATLTAQDLREAAQAASQRQEEFLAMLAHELRNPLAPIGTAIALLAKLGNTPVPEGVLGMLRRQVRHMGRLLDDLLDVSRITQGKVELRRVPTAVADVVEQGVETCRDLIAAKQQQLAVDLPAKPVFIDGDPARLVQIVANLVQNAAKYTQQGGKISVVVRRQADDVVLRVRDNGMGISAEALPHVFDLFVQGERGLGRAEGGLGIGLTVVRRMAELHGGTVEAHSNGFEQGSEFVLTFPSAASSGDATSIEPHQAEPMPVPTSVLVVEDSVDAGEALAQLLRLSGHEVAVAADGVSAMETFAASRPRVVLCDIGLPGIDGYEVAGRMRTLQHEPRPAIVAITGYGGPDVWQRCLAAGFDHHLVKPVDPEELLRLIDSAVRP